MNVSPRTINAADSAAIGKAITKKVLRFIGASQELADNEKLRDCVQEAALEQATNPVLLFRESMVAQIEAQSGGVAEQLLLARFDHPETGAGASTESVLVPPNIVLEDAELTLALQSMSAYQLSLVVFAQFLKTEPPPEQWAIHELSKLRLLELTAKTRGAAIEAIALVLGEMPMLDKQELRKRTIDAGAKCRDALVDAANVLRNALCSEAPEPRVDLVKMMTSGALPGSQQAWKIAWLFFLAVLQQLFFEVPRTPFPEGNFKMQLLSDETLRIMTNSVIAATATEFSDIVISLGYNALSRYIARGGAERARSLAYSQRKWRTFSGFIWGIKDFAVRMLANYVGADLSPSQIAQWAANVQGRRYDFRIARDVRLNPDASLIDPENVTIIDKYITGIYEVSSKIGGTKLTYSPPVIANATAILSDDLIATYAQTPADHLTYAAVLILINTLGTLFICGLTPVLKNWCRGPPSALVDYALAGNPELPLPLEGMRVTQEIPPIRPPRSIGNRATARRAVSPGRN
jgi:hypothetical protein